MIVKQLVGHGNSKALIIDKSLLAAANLPEDTLFGIVVAPNGGLTIQSIASSNEKLFKDSLDKVIKKHGKLFKSLADK